LLRVGVDRAGVAVLAHSYTAENVMDWGGSPDVDEQQPKQIRQWIMVVIAVWTALAIFCVIELAEFFFS